MARQNQRINTKKVDYDSPSPSFKEEVDDDSSISENSESDQEYHPTRKTRRERKQTTKISGKNKTSPVKNETTCKKTNELSEYEQQILLNVEERKKMFQMIVGDAKKDFMKTIPPAAKKKASQNGPKEKVAISIEVPPLSMSLRRRGKLLLDELKTDNDLEAKKSGPFTMGEARCSDQDLVADAKFIMDERIPLLEIEGELEKLTSDQQSFMKLMKNFSIKDEGIAKLSRIYSLNWHPSSSKLLLAAGDSDGNIVFWDVDHLEQELRAFKIHDMPIKCASFDKFNPTRLLTTSADGYVRCMDLQTNAIDEVYSIETTNAHFWTPHHAQKDPSTLVVSQSNGDVVVVDIRKKPGRVENLIQCFGFGKSTRTLSLHPQDDNLFMVGNRYGEAGIFDMRYTAENKDDLAVPVISFPKAPRGVNGAFFSSITGKYALTTCTDDTIKLYDIEKGSSEAKCIKSIQHNNFISVTSYDTVQAIWHPTRDDVFIIGSTKKPRRVELYGAPTGQLLHNFCSKALNSVISINAFHPSIPILACCSYHGRIHIFRP